MNQELFLLNKMKDTFDRQDVIHFYSQANIKISDKTMSNYLRSLIEQDLIIRVKQGVFLKKSRS